MDTLLELLNHPLEETDVRLSMSTIAALRHVNPQEAIAQHAAEEVVRTRGRPQPPVPTGRPPSDTRRHGQSPMAGSAAVPGWTGTPH